MTRSRKINRAWPSADTTIAATYPHREARSVWLRTGAGTLRFASAGHRRRHLRHHPDILDPRRFDRRHSPDHYAVWYLIIGTHEDFAVWPLAPDGCQLNRQIC